MVYVADLAPVLREVARVLMPGGLLAFTVETHGGDGVILGGRLRYAHGAGCVRTAIETAGLDLSRCEERSARNEDNVPAPGLVVVATKPPRDPAAATRYGHGSRPSTKPP